MFFARKLLIVLMIVWLPLAGAMAATMPVARSVAAAGDAAPMPCHSNITSDSTADTSSGTAKTSLPGGTCSHCDLCHLAVAIAVPAMPVVNAVLPASDFAPDRVGAPPSFIPDLLLPPPRA